MCFQIVFGSLFIIKRISFSASLLIIMQTLCAAQSKFKNKSSFYSYLSYISYRYQD